MSAFLSVPDEAAKAQLNINFIDYVVAPLWKLIANKMFPALFTNVRYLEENKKQWQKIKDEMSATASASAPAPPASSSSVASTSVGAAATKAETTIVAAAVVAPSVPPAAESNPSTNQPS